MVRRIGHRGASGHAPENSFAAFDRAVELGCDELETDVWSTPRGLLVGHERPGEDAELPTLQAVLDHCAGRIAVNVELKAERSAEQAREVARRVAELLRQRNGADVYVSSFWWTALEESARRSPGLRRAYVFSAAPPLDALIPAARSLGLWALHPNRTYVTSQLVDAAHRAGMRVNAWTVNDPAEIAVLIELGVDGIMSDYPERVPKT
jgi:glycerophosphoryl diester phosphodiesterase